MEPADVLSRLPPLWPLVITPQDAAFRLGAALLLGAMIGVERERKDRPAGLRTYMIVSLASALFTIVAFEMFDRVSDMAGEGNLGADPLRLLEAVTAGVAFLAAGTMIRREGDVKGVTTGAGLWLSGAMGIACGQAMYGLALMAAVLALIVLALVRLVE